MICLFDFWKYPIFFEDLLMRIYALQSVVFPISCLVMISHLCFGSSQSVTIDLIYTRFSLYSLLPKSFLLLLQLFDKLYASNWTTV